MSPRENCAFDKLLMKNFPHILEMIFFSLDYRSFSNCKKVSNAWTEVLKSVSFQKEANSFYEEERDNNEEKLTRACNARRIQHLLSIGVDPNCEDRWGITPLYRACQRGRPEVVKMLLDAGADPNMSTLLNSPLYAAVKFARGKRHNSVIKLLLDAGTDPNQKNSYGYALHTAITESNIEAVKLLINAGADPNKSNKEYTPRDDLYLPYFDTPLHKTARINKNKESRAIEIVEILLKAGADPHKPNNKGKTALDLAEVEGNTGVAALLQGAMKSFQKHF